jgi:hypothetical protein
VACSARALVHHGKTQRVTILILLVHFPRNLRRTSRQTMRQQSVCQRSACPAYIFECVCNAHVCVCMCVHSSGRACAMERTQDWFQDMFFEYLCHWNVCTCVSLCVCSCVCLCKRSAPKRLDSFLDMFSMCVYVCLHLHDFGGFVCVHTCI